MIKWLTSAATNKAWKNSALQRTWTHDLCTNLQHCTTFKCELNIVAIKIKRKIIEKSLKSMKIKTYSELSFTITLLVHWIQFPLSPAKIGDHGEGLKLEKLVNFSSLNTTYCIFQCISWPFKSQESLQKLTSTYTPSKTLTVCHTSFRVTVTN